MINKSHTRTRMGHITSAMSSSSDTAPSETKRPVFEVEGPEEEEERNIDRTNDVIMDLGDLDEEEGEEEEEEEEETEEEEEKKPRLDSIRGMTAHQTASVQNLLDLAEQQIKTGSNAHVPNDACVIAVDLETTGLLLPGKEPPRIIELAAVSLSNPSEFISCLVKLPEDVTIHPKAKQVNKIDEKMCAEFGKSEIEALLDFVVFIQDQIKKHGATKVYLVAHNAFEFDAVLLTQAFYRQRFQTTPELAQVFWVDSLVVARESGHHKMNSLGALMKTSFPGFDSASMHRALADCLALCALVHSNRANMFGSLFFEKNTKKFDGFSVK